MTQHFWLSHGQLSDIAWPGDVLTTSGDRVWADRFVSCQSYASAEALEVEVSRPGRRFGLMFGTGFMPVVDGGVAELFRSHAGEDVELIPASLQGFEEPYWIVNALRCVDCIDEYRTMGTRYTRDSPRPDKEGHYDNVRDLVLRKEAIEGLNVLRPDRFTSALIVSNRLFGPLLNLVGECIWYQQVTR
jgi:hypothetical protein